MRPVVTRMIRDCICVVLFYWVVVIERHPRMAGLTVMARTCNRVVASDADYMYILSDVEA